VRKPLPGAWHGSHASAVHRWGAQPCKSSDLASPEAGPSGTAASAQAGPGRLEAVLKSAGLGTLREAAETPFDLIIEARR
jgi:hypothetical protein